MKPRATAATASSYVVRIDPARLILGLAIIAVLLVAIHSMLALYHYRVHEIPWLPWRQLFDVDEENNLPTWFSAFLLALTAGWLWVCAHGKQGAGDSWWLEWYGLAVGFLLLSLDEVAGLHESLNSLIAAPWAIPGGIVAALVGLAYIPFLRHLPATTRYSFVGAGLLYLGGALGMELVGAPIEKETLLYNFSTAGEEGLEMCGVIVFLAALFSYMRGHARTAQPLAVDVGFKAAKR